MEKDKIFKLEINEDWDHLQYIDENENERHIGCGDLLEAKINGKWQAARVEYTDEGGYFFVGFPKITVAGTLIKKNYGR